MNICVLPCWVLNSWNTWNIFVFFKTRLGLWKKKSLLGLWIAKNKHTSPMTPSFIINMMSSMVAIAMLLSMSHVWSVNVTDEPLGPCKPLIKLSFLASSDLLHNLKCEGPVGFFLSSKNCIFSWKNQWSKIFEEQKQIAKFYVYSVKILLILLIFFWN